jgi:hypothetical protein
MGDERPPPLLQRCHTAQGTLGSGVGAQQLYATTKLCEELLVIMAVIEVIAVFLGECNALYRHVVLDCGLSTPHHEARRYMRRRVHVSACQDMG